MIQGTATLVAGPAWSSRSHGSHDRRVDATNVVIATGSAPEAPPRCRGQRPRHHQRPGPVVRPDPVVGRRDRGGRGRAGVRVDVPLLRRRRHALEALPVARAAGGRRGLQGDRARLSQAGHHHGQRAHRWKRSRTRVAGVEVTYPRPDGDTAIRRGRHLPRRHRSGPGHRAASASRTAGCVDAREGVRPRGRAACARTSQASGRSATSPPPRCSSPTSPSTRATRSPNASPGSRSPEIDYVNIPRVTYCTPEIASVGLTEAQARERGMDVVTEKLDFRGIGKANILGEGGFVKVVAEADPSAVPARSSGST